VHFPFRMKGGLPKDFPAGSTSFFFHSGNDLIQERGIRFLFTELDVPCFFFSPNKRVPFPAVDMLMIS